MSKDLQKQFEALSKMSEYIRPDQEWVASNKQKLFAQIQNSTAFEKKETRLLEIIEYWMPRQKVLFPLRIAVILFIISGMTIGSWIAGVSASNDSLPGEVLYKVKLAAENTQLAVTTALANSNEKASKKATLQLQFAQRRSSEVKQLLAQQSPEANVHVPETIQKLKDTLKEAQDTVQEAKKEDSSHVITLAKSVSEKTSLIALELKEVTNKEPLNVSLAKEAAEATKIVNDTGLKAIEAVLEDKKVVADSNVQEIKNLVEQKVNILVQNIQDNKNAVEEVKQLSAITTSTVETLVSSTSSVKSMNTQVTTTLLMASSTVPVLTKEDVKKVGEDIKKADQVVGEVKQLLEGNQVKEALQKAKTLNDLTTETQQNIADTKNKVTTSLLPLTAPVATPEVKVETKEEVK